MRKIPLFFLILTFHSCLEEANCLLTATNFVIVDLKKNSDNSAASIKFNSISISGTSLTFKSDQASSRIALPVNPDATQTTFVFNYNATEADPATSKTNTLTLSYANSTRLISKDCGAYQYQTDLAIDYSDFEKIKLVNSSLLTTLTTPNLEIYF